MAAQQPPGCGKGQFGAKLPMETANGPRPDSMCKSKLLIYLVSRLGLEPRALALKGRCSTD